jgi:lipoprotein-anchoring transpeptidase ErfK/SrfK
MSPDDPRYGRPAYSNARLPTGPVMSPDDPRYGRPAGPPQVIYADRPPVRRRPSATTAFRAPGYVTNEDALRPPGAIGAAPPVVTGAVPPQAPAGADGRPIQLSALPPEEQPEVGAVQTAAASAPHRKWPSPPRSRPAPSWSIRPTPISTTCSEAAARSATASASAATAFTWTGVQKITKKAEWPDWHPPTEMIERQPYLPRFMAGGTRQSARRARDVSRLDRLSHPRHQPALDDRASSSPPAASAC